jgi:siroheme synthase (precorrin-2 oxidase/ferrochelatase)
MKTARFPSIRVEAALRSDIESLLKEGETLSAFVAASVREQVRKRQLQDEFIRRGLVGLEVPESSVS